MLFSCTPGSTTWSRTWPRTRNEWRTNAECWRKRSQIFIAGRRSTRQRRWTPAITLSPSESSERRSEERTIDRRIHLTKHDSWLFCRFAYWAKIFRRTEEIYRKILCAKICQKKYVYVITNYTTTYNIWEGSITTKLPKPFFVFLYLCPLSIIEAFNRQQPSLYFFLIWQ